MEWCTSVVLAWQGRLQTDLMSFPSKRAEELTVCRKNGRQQLQLHHQLLLEEQRAPPPLFQDHLHNPFHPSQTLASCRSLSTYSSVAKYNPGVKSSGFSVNSNAPEEGKGVLYLKRTRNATDAVVGKSLMKSDMSVGV